MNMILLLIGFVGLLAVGAPIMVAMGLPAIIYYIVSGTSLSLVAYSFYQSTMSFSLLAVPAFILMGNLVSELGETARAFDFARALAKGKRGYSSRIAVVLSLIFAGMSGAAIAGVCGLGPIFVDSMEEEGYERDYGAALTIAASTVGPIFPPSIPLVLYATIAQISSVKSLLGGVGPGILMSAMLLFYVLLVDKKKLVNPPMAKAMMKEERHSGIVLPRSSNRHCSSPDSDYDAVRNLQPGRDRRHGCALYAAFGNLPPFADLERILEMCKRDM